MDQYARHLENLIQTYCHAANRAQAQGDFDRAKYLKATMEGVCNAQEAYLEIKRAEAIAAQAANSMPAQIGPGQFSLVHFDPRQVGNEEK